MTEDSDDVVEFDELVALAYAELAIGPAPRAIVKTRLMARIAEIPQAPAGFGFRMAADDDWLPHPVPGIRMKVLSVKRSATSSAGRFSRWAAVWAREILSTPTPARNMASCGRTKARKCCSSCLPRITCLPLLADASRIQNSEFIILNS